MDIKGHLDKVDALKKQMAKLNQELVDYLKNSTNLLLTERWDLFLHIDDVLPISPFIGRLDTLHRDVVGYDQLVHVEHRDSVVHYSYIVECLEEEFLYWMQYKNPKKDSPHKVIEKMIEDGAERLGIIEEDEYDSRIEESFYSQLDAVKLEILEAGAGGFHYDW